MDIFKTFLTAAALSLGAIPAQATPEDFIYTSAGELEVVKALLARQDIGGAQVVYNWKLLEKAKGEYDFSPIEKDVAVANSLNKKLFIQIQDRFFSPTARNIPDYVLKGSEYGGGLAPQFDNAGENQEAGSGWVAQQWNPAVRARYQALLAALATKFDGRIYGINLPETAIDLDPKNEPKGFSCDAYFSAEVENLGYARKVFSKSVVVQYVNFWPCEWENNHNYMSRLFDFAAKNDIGLGGPDIVPNRKAQMKNSYPFFNRFKGKLSYVGMAAQEPTLTYKNPKTGKPFTKAEFASFAEDYLGAKAIFRSTSSAWLKQ